MSRSSVRRPVIGVMGAGESASVAECVLGERLGERIAAEGWVLLTGGRDAGVMAAAIRGAKRIEGSLTIGILPAASGPVAPGLDVAIFTGMGNARNAISVLSSRVVVACGAGSAGTASEVALAFKSGIPVVLVGASLTVERFFRKLGGVLCVARSDEEAIARIRDVLSEFPA
jgi:uncharacterized protein (TIGR00725 family)